MHCDDAAPSQRTWLPSSVSGFQNCVAQLSADPALADGGHDVCVNGGRDELLPVRSQCLPIVHGGDDEHGVARTPDPSA